MLHHRWAVDEAQAPVPEDDSVQQLRLSGISGIDRNVADSLTGHRQIFGVGVNGYRSLVVRKDMWVSEAVEDDAPVGLVAEQENLCSVLLLLPGY